MTYNTLPIGVRRFSLWCWEQRRALAVLASMVAMPTLAHAHGNMGPDELGPPMMTAGALGFAAYWIVMLWPSRSGKPAIEPRVSASDTMPSKPAPRRSARVKRMPPRLRKIEGRGRFEDEQETRRRASDG